MIDRTPPHDADAEQAVIGCVLHSPAIYRHVQLTAGEFYRPPHSEIWAAMGELDRTGRPCDAIATHQQLLTRGSAARVGGAPYLQTCMQVTPPAANVAYYASVVSELAGRRRTIDALTRGLQLAYEGTRDNEAVLEECERMLSAVPSRDSGDVDSLMTLDEFVDLDRGPVRWVIPGLLQTAERLIVTAAEGLGKSVLIRQLAACAAAGVPPLSGRPFEPVKVLLVDVENPPRIMAEVLGDIRHALRSRMASAGDRLWIESRMGGVNLADPAHRRWLHRRAEAVRPDLLVIGPAYKLYRGGGGERDEDLARGVTEALDEIREEYECAIVLEHHSAKATEGKYRTVDPFGSSLWMRWPEFGLGLRKADHPAADQLRLVDVVPWRGARARRTWPRRLQANADGLPWAESML